MPARAFPAANLSLASAAVLTVAGLSGAAAIEPAPAQDIAVRVDNAKIMRLPEKTQTVVVGNPVIADVALQRNGVVILTGKSFGQTNLIALDAGGVMLAETTISVRNADQASTVTVQRGSDKRNSYSCTPACERSIQLGDSNDYFTDVSNQAEQRRTLAASGGR